MKRVGRIKGCLLGGAVGDVLGAPVEFLEWSAIRAKFGLQGIVDFAPAYGMTGAITDDTQMMLFTAEGLLRAYVRGSSRGICHVPSVIHHALLRRLMTQDYQTTTRVSLDGWLVKERALWSRRAPGHTCISALKASQHFGFLAENNSKGCGAVMRVAPCAFFGNAFDYAAESGRLTHGHPTGYMSAGLFADILQRMADRQDSLEHALTESLAAHGHKPGMEETRAILENVLFYFYEGYRPCRSWKERQIRSFSKPSIDDAPSCQFSLRKFSVSDRVGSAGFRKYHFNGGMLRNPVFRSDGSSSLSSSTGTKYCTVLSISKSSISPSHRCLSACRAKSSTNCLARHTAHSSN